jgi:hypothetical protein
MDTATFHGGQVQVYEDNLTDIAENLFWFREMADQNSAANTALLKQITDLLKLIQIDIHALTQEQQNNLVSPVNSVNLQVLQQVERPSAKLQKAIDWLTAHPERAGETSRALAAEIGVSHTTVAKAQHLVNL